MTMATIQQIGSIVVVNDNGILTQYNGTGEIEFKFQRGMLQVVPSQEITVCDITAKRQKNIETLRNNDCKQEFLSLISTTKEVLVVDDDQSFVIDGFIYKCRVFWNQHMLCLQQCDGSLEVEQEYNTCLIPIRKYSICGNETVCGFAVSVDTMLHPKMKTISSTNSTSNSSYYLNSSNTQTTLVQANQFEFLVTKSPFPI